MESQPQNPKLKINPETFTHVEPQNPQLRINPENIIHVEACYRFFYWVLGLIVWD